MSEFDNPTLVTAPHRLPLPGPLRLDCGRELASVEIGFETYGTLSPGRDNAVLVCHSLTKNAHAAGRHGWWDAAIGPGKMLDTDRYFVISTDTLAAGRSTGPASVDPTTGQPYGMRFPVVTIADMVRAQYELLNQLGIEQAHAVIGGCFGGAQAIEWAIAYPEAVRNAIVITTTPATSAHTIAIFSVMRHLIRSDPAWNGGDYYQGVGPWRGLGAAVAAGVPLWMSREAMERKFGRDTVTSGDYGYTLDPEFKVEEFITQVAGRAGQQIDPNGLMYLMRAEEYFDLQHSYGTLDAAAKRILARVLFVSYASDWRYPAEQTERMHQALLAARGDSRHLVLDSGLGHGAFLFEVAGLASEVREFIGTAP